MASIPNGDKKEDRVEPIPRPDFPHHLYPMWIGHKFEPDGELLPFPGNTIICHVPPASEIYRALLGLYDELKMQEFASWYVLLPPESWHMTVFEGVSDKIRKSSSWPGDLALNAPLSKCTALLQDKVATFELGTKPPFNMKVEGYDPLTEGIALKVEAATVSGDQQLRTLRNRLSEHLRMRHPGHETYSFHISLAYLLRKLTPDERRQLSDFLEAYRSRLPETFELGAPEFCVFDDMFAFGRRCFLDGQTEGCQEIRTR